MPRFSSDEDGYLTLRIPRLGLALVIALAVHALAFALGSLLPDPQKAPARIELALVPPPPPPAPPASPAPSAPPPAPTPKKPRARPPKAPPSPVVPALPPSDSPPAHRVQLPVAEPAPAPVPPSAPATWEERLAAQLARTRPRSWRTLQGPLAPSSAALARVAASDARLQDAQTERRLMASHGSFFRRGLEALRGVWHPADVLEATERDPARRCGSRNRTTFAVAVLDKEGMVVDVELRGSSGCPELDDEAIAAFKRVARFPHPPAGIFVAPDGTPTETARYPVRFMVTFDGGLRLDWRG